MAYSDIFPGANGLALLGGPVLSFLPKSSTNATGASIPGVKVPYTSPADMLNALTNQQNVSSESALRKQQAELFNAQVAQLKQQQQFYPAINGLLRQLGVGGAQSADTATTPGEAPSGEAASPVAPLPGASVPVGPIKSFADALNTPETGGNPGYVPFNHKSGTAYLGDLANASAASALGPDYSVKMTSGERPGATVAGTGGTSQHALGNAADFQIIGPDGKAIPNEGDDTTGAYGKLAVEMRQRMDPRIAPFLAWGGNFTTGPQNGPRDLMHFDLGGDRGRYGSLTQLAQATPQTMTDAGTAAPAGAPAPSAAPAPPMTPDQFNAQARARLAQGNLAPGGAIPGAIGGMDPRLIAALGVASQAARLPDIATPLQKYYYNDPRYLAAAEAAKANATKGVELQYAGPIAAATTRAKMQIEPQQWRPGMVGTQLGPDGKPHVVFGNPQFESGAGGYVNPLTNTFSPTPNYAEGAKDVAAAAAQGKANAPQFDAQAGGIVTPGTNTFSPTPNYAGGISGVVGARLGAENTAKYGDLLPTPQAPSFQGRTFAPGSAPSAPNATDQAATPTDRGTVIPNVLKQGVLPTGTAQLDAAIPAWQKKETEWTEAITPAREAEQRLMTIADAFKQIQTGAFTTHKADFVAGLKAAGIDLPDSMLTDPAKVEMVLHENYLQTMQRLKASTSRFTQQEFRVTSENSEHPNIQPEANLQMLGEDVAMLRQAQQLPADWIQAKTQGWRNPLAFESAWSAANPLDHAVNKVKSEIGPLKGMERAGAPDLPPGSRQIGTYRGNPVYEVPDGKGGVTRKVLQ